MCQGPCIPQSLAIVKEAHSKALQEMESLNSQLKKVNRYSICDVSVFYMSVCAYAYMSVCVCMCVLMYLCHLCSQ